MRELKKGELLTVSDINRYFNLGALPPDYVFAFEHRGEE